MISVFSILLLNSYSPFSFLSSNNIDHSLCSAPVLSHRVARDPCWVKFSLASERQLCLTPEVWRTWLQAPLPPLLCAHVDDPHPKRRWKAYAPPQNASLQHAQHAKKTLWVQTLSQFSDLPHMPTSPQELLWWTILQRIERVRERTSQLLTLTETESPFRGILHSLLLDEKPSPAPLSFLRKLGFVHLVTTTGIHLYAVSYWIQEGMRILSLRISLLGFPLSAGRGHLLGRMLSFMVCLCLWVLNGSRLGMLRPWIVILCREAALLLGLKWRKAAPLFCALCAEFFMALFRNGFNTSNALQSGRWIYALAVGGGLFWCHSFRSLHLGLAVGSWLLVAFWDLYETSSLALATPLLSLVTLPLTCSLGFPLLVLGIFLNEFHFKSGAVFLLKTLFQFFDFLLTPFLKLSLLPGNLWVIPPWAVWTGALLAAGFIVLRPRSSTDWKWALLFSLLILPFRLHSRPLTEASPDTPQKRIKEDSRLTAQQIKQLDVGQGDGALILGPFSSVGLIDVGKAQAFTETTWLNLWTTHQLTAIDWIAISHLDEDHVGGLLKLASLIPIGCVAISPGELRTPRGERWSQKLKKLGVRVDPWSKRGCIPFPHFVVPITPKKGRGRQRNAHMGAVLIPLASGGFYLTAGDASQKDEAMIADWALPFIKRLTPTQKEGEHRGQRILKISHHGSKNSTDPEWLRHLSPTEVWISVGQGNSYGHPHPTVLNLLSKIPHLRVRRTDRDGLIELKEATVPHRP